MGETSERGKPIKILIVVNTVKRCQDLAKALRMFDPVCYHSKFVFLDRYKKEKHILDDKPRLLIATQVVEVSLELDYDVMHAECLRSTPWSSAPGASTGFVVLFWGKSWSMPPEAGSEKIYGEPAGVLEASWDLCRDHPGALTERGLMEFVERAYAGHVLSDAAAYRDIQARVKDQQATLGGRPR